MGMDRKVLFPGEKMPQWKAVVEHLARKNLPIQMRMIDGQLAFPDQEPPADWRELRIGTAGGMITIKREADGVRLVIWGNADANLQQAWQTLADSWAQMTGGLIQDS